MAYSPLPNPWTGYPLVGPFFDNIRDALTDLKRRRANVRDFGAVGDGVTDDTAAFIAAIAAAYRAEDHPLVGGCIFMPHGRYLISSSLVVPGYVSFLGDGTAVTTLAAKANTDFDLFTASGGSVNYCMFKDFSVDMNGPNQGVVTTNRALYGQFNKSLFDNVEMTNSKNIGIQIQGGNTFIRDCVFHGTNWGAHFTLTDSMVTRCSISGSSRSCVIDNGPVVVSDCHFHGGPPYNLFMFPATWVTLTGCIFEDAQIASIRLEYPNYYGDLRLEWVIANNFFTQLGPTTDGIQLVGFDADQRIGDIIISNNRFLADTTARYPVYAEHASGIVVIGNHFRGSFTDHAVHLQEDCNDFVIVGNDNNTFGGGGALGAINELQVAIESVHVVGAVNEPAFANSWANYNTSGWQSAGFWKDAQGVVHLRGLVKNGSGFPTTIFTLPAGYRPAQVEHFPINSASAFGSCYIDASGNVVAENGSAVALSLGGISFRTD